jgi:SpoVK/Ycf46/Vps4 family AAA+-type ATPase
MSTDKDFIIKVRAGNSLLVVNSYEEFRVLEQYVRELSNTAIKKEGKVVGKYKSFSWDIDSGIRELSALDSGVFQISEYAMKYKKDYKDFLAADESYTPERYKTEEPTETSEMNPIAPLKFLEQAETGTVMFLKDYHPYFQTEEFEHAKVLKRTIRNLAQIFKAQNKCLVFLSPDLKVPTELEKEVTFIDFNLPSKETLKRVLEGVVGQDTPENKMMPKGENLEAVLDAAAGMTAIEAENAFAVSLTTARKIDASIIRAEKAQVVKKSGMLEIIEATETMDDIGGLENLKDYITTRRHCFTKAARDFGVKPVKGILLRGVPGCGKSLAAKATASGLQRPLVRLDFGKIYGSYVGESEKNLGQCLKVLTSIAPCVCWVDEIEKGLSGNKSGQEGHETTRRVFQMLLTWMQEKKEDVLLFATANSTASLPPELLRAGRIDATFFVDLPDVDQRAEIFKIHLRKAKRNPNMFDANLDELMQLSNNFTGAELEVWVAEAITRAFSLGHSDIQIEDLREAVKEVTPIYRLQADQINKSRQEAAADGVKNASRVKVTAPVTTARTPAARVINAE